jgi:hypothetical protein
MSEVEIGQLSTDINVCTRSKKYGLECLHEEGRTIYGGVKGCAISLSHTVG